MSSAAYRPFFLCFPQVQLAPWAKLGEPVALDHLVWPVALEAPVLWVLPVPPAAPVLVVSQELRATLGLMVALAQRVTQVPWVERGPLDRQDLVDRLEVQAPQDLRVWRVLQDLQDVPGLQARQDLRDKQVCTAHLQPLLVCLVELRDGVSSWWPFNSLRPGDAYVWRWTRSSLDQIMACRLFGAKPLS